MPSILACIFSCYFNVIYLEKSFLCFFFSNTLRTNKDETEQNKNLYKCVDIHNNRMLPPTMKTISFKRYIKDNISQLYNKSGSLKTQSENKLTVFMWCAGKKKSIYQLNIYLTQLQTRIYYCSQVVSHSTSKICNTLSLSN